MFIGVFFTDVTKAGFIAGNISPVPVGVLKQSHTAFIFSATAWFFHPVQISDFPKNSKIMSVAMVVVGRIKNKLLRTPLPVSGADNLNKSSNLDVSMKFGRKHPYVILFHNQS